MKWNKEKKFISCLMIGNYLVCPVKLEYPFRNSPNFQSQNYSASSTSNIASGSINRDFTISTTTSTASTTSATTSTASAQQVQQQAQQAHNKRHNKCNNKHSKRQQAQQQFMQFTQSQAIPASVQQAKQLAIQWAQSQGIPTNSEQVKNGCRKSYTSYYAESQRTGNSTYTSASTTNGHRRTTETTMDTRNRNWRYV